MTVSNDPLPLAPDRLPPAGAPTLGILGGGQLGRMLALAAATLGVRVRCYDPSPDACAGQVSDLHVGEYSDEGRLDRFAAGADAITYEFENVPVETAERLARSAPVFPPPAALRTCQDRLLEKTLFRSLGIGTAAFEPVETRADLDRAIDRIGLPAVLKTRRFGYDGKGQAVLRQPADADHAWSRLTGGRAGVALILEAFVPFDRELSIIAARGRGRARATVAYPLTENVHADGILRVSRAPAGERRLTRPAESSPSLQWRAEALAGAVMDAMNYAGVLAVEMFEVEGRLLANEMAPRVHNSGHWTLDAPGVPSQFENHVRAVLGLPLAAPRLPEGVCAGMVNLVGESPPVPALDRLAAIDGARVHLYGKPPRAGRKIGHVNFSGDRSAVERGIATVGALIGLPARAEAPATPRE